jgi:hypothetical protein
MMERAGARFRGGMRAERVYVASILVGLTVAGLVGWQIVSARDTHCFLRSLNVRVAQPKNSKPIRDVLKGCLPKDTASTDKTAKKVAAKTTPAKYKAFVAVRSNILAQRQKLATDTKYTPQETDKVKAKSAVVVWIALLTFTAGFAGFVAVQSVVIVRELKPRWNKRFLGVSAGAAILLALPFVLFRVLPEGLRKLGQFDDLHHSQLMWTQLLGGVLIFPALVGLVAIADVLMSRTNLRLAQADCLGSRMRQLISMLGAALALLVLTTAARWQAIGELPGGEAAPKVVILMWGSLYAVVLGVLYIPVYQRWAQETGTLIAHEVRRQMPDDQSLPGTAGFRSAEMSLTRELNVRLRMGGALASFQGSFAVLAPVIAGAIASLFGG